MRFFVVCGILGLLAGAVANAIQLHASPSVTIDGKVVKVIDGDTLVIESLVRYHVRLTGNWAPESRTKDLAEKKRGLKSKARMIELADGKEVRVNIPIGVELGDSITMSRVLGRAWLIKDGKPEADDLSTIMVREGLATEVKTPK